MQSRYFYLLMTIGAGFIMYLSWLPSPKLSETSLLPIWLTNWTDQEKNGTIRTAVPFMLLGLVISMRLIHRKSKFIQWVFYLFLLFMMVVVAELGQLVLPQRVFDWQDIGWGILGTLLGMTSGFILIHIKNLAFKLFATIRVS